MAVRIILFLMIFLFLFENISRVLAFEGSSTKTRLFGLYEEPKDSIDVVFMGPSSVYPYFIPGLAYQEYGVVSYNCTAPDMSTRTMPYSIEELDKLQSPDLYVIDIRVLVSHEYAPKETQLRRVIDTMELGKAKISAIQTLIEEDRISYYLNIIKYHDRWKSINGKDINVLLRKTDKHKGYAVSLKTDPVKEEAWLGTTQEREPMTEVAENMLRELLTYCKENDVNVLFTAAPWCLTETKKKKTNYMKDIVEEYGYIFIETNDYYEDLEWDFDTDMKDAKHANIFGATKYTRFMMDYLVEHYEFEDKRQDLKYEGWTQAYGSYLKSYAKMVKRQEKNNAT